MLTSLVDAVVYAVCCLCCLCRLCRFSVVHREVLLPLPALPPHKLAKLITDQLGSHWEILCRFAKKTRRRPATLFKKIKRKKVVWTGRNFRITNRYNNFLQKFLPFIVKSPTQSSPAYATIITLRLHIGSTYIFLDFIVSLETKNRHKLISLSLKEEGQKDTLWSVSCLHTQHSAGRTNRKWDSMPFLSVQYVLWK